MPSPDTPIRILYVEDDPEFAEMGERFLRRENDRFEIETAASASGGAECLASGTFDCVVSDYDMPGQNGIEFLERLREEYPDLPFVLYTGKGSEEVASDAISAGVTDYLQKGTGTDQYTVLANRIENAVEQYRSRQALDDRNRELRRYKQMVNSMHEAACIYDPEGRFEVVNEYLAQWYDVTPEALVSTHSNLIPRIREQAEGDPYQELLAGERRELRGELVAEFPGHGHAELAYRLTPLVVAGTVDGVVGVARDITDRKERERKREMTVAFLRKLYDVAIDERLDVNEKITRLLELGPEQFDLPSGYLTRIEVDETTPEGGTQRVIEASGDHELLQPGNTCPLAQSYCRRTIETDEVVTIHDALAAGWAGDPAYELFDLGCYLGTRITVDDELYGTVFFAAKAPREEPFTDVEQAFVRLVSQLVSYELGRDHAERALKQQNEQLEEFTSVVSHDLRNPLAVAEGQLALGREACDNEHFERVKRAHERMDALIQDLLALAREGETVSELEPVVLAECSEACWRTVETADATLVTATDGTVAADRSKLRQLLENLYRNAVEHGGDDVTVTVGALDTGFYVEDDGPGIPEPERDRVFETGYSTSGEGTGFGLSIVEQIVSAHGWEIRVTEGSGGGARFEVTGVEFTTG